jgi:hypothetical protein
VRASRADAWITGVLTGAVVFAALSALIALTSANRLAQVEPWQAILFPALVFAIPLLVGALVTEWREAGSGALARLRDRVEAAPSGWGEVPGLLARGSAVVVAGLIGLGALVFAVSLLLRGGEVIALYEAAHVDALGATVLTLAQLAYLPTLVIWGMAFVAGPGFAVGADTAVSPSGTQLGVIPGIPVLGALPESTTSWLLLLALLPVALGALAGWVVRSRLAAPPAVETAPRRPTAQQEPVVSDSGRSSALAALLAADGADRAVLQVPGPDAAGAAEVRRGPDPIGPRAVLALGIAIASAGAAAVLSLLASGSLGPGRLAEAGPPPGPVALAVGAEVLIGAAILLLSPRRRARKGAVAAATVAEQPTTGAAVDARPFHAQADALPAGPHVADRPSTDRPFSDRPVTDPPVTDRFMTDRPFSDRPFSDRPVTDSPSGDGPDGPDDVDTVDLGPRRPAPLPPVD